MDRKPAATVQAWLEALMRDEDPVGGSVAALRVASSLVRMEPTFLDRARSARILLDESGEPCAAADGLFRPAPLPVEVDARSSIPTSTERQTSI